MIVNSLTLYSKPLKNYTFSVFVKQFIKGYYFYNDKSNINDFAALISFFFLFQLISLNEDLKLKGTVLFIIFLTLHPPTLQFYYRLYFVILAHLFNKILTAVNRSSILICQLIRTVPFSTYNGW